MGSRILCGDGAARDRRCLRQFHAGGRDGARARGLRQQLHAAGGAEGQIRPGQPVPAEPERATESVADKASGTTFEESERSTRGGKLDIGQWLRGLTMAKGQLQPRTAKFSDISGASENLAL